MSEENQSMSMGDELAALSGQKFCVTGAAGFIGSHLTKALARIGGREIIALDNLAYGDWTNLGLDCRAIHRLSEDFSTANAALLEAQLTGCDTLFHFAAEKHNNAIDSPQRVLDVNVAGTQKLFAAAGRAGVRRVVFASSLYAYGRMQGMPMCEDQVPEPRTVYGVSKLAGEGLLREAGERYGMSTCALRLFFVYGPRQFSGTGYPSVIVRNFRRILAGEPPVIYGDGAQVMDYIHVDDVVTAILRSALSDVDGIINVASGEGISVRHLVDTMCKVSNQASSPVFAPADWTAGSCRVGDASRIRRLLGWQPVLSLEDGLRSVWHWLASAVEMHR